MSATGRGAERNADDFYETPAWCVHRLLEAVPLPGGNWLEPAAGHGAIIRAVNRSDVNWTAVDIRHEAGEHLLKYVRPIEVKTGIDFLAGGWTPDRRVVITNPPYSVALAFIRHALSLAPYVVMLLRLNFLGSAKRATVFAGDMPDVYVLPNRPSFSPDGKTDSVEYAWFVWTPQRYRSRGMIQVLAQTPRAERKAA